MSTRAANAMKPQGGPPPLSSSSIRSGGSEVTQASNSGSGAGSGAKAWSAVRTNTGPESGPGGAESGPNAGMGLGSAVAAVGGFKLAAVKGMGRVWSSGMGAWAGAVGNGAVSCTVSCRKKAGSGRSAALEMCRGCGRSAAEGLVGRGAATGSSVAGRGRSNSSSGRSAGLPAPCMLAAGARTRTSPSRKQKSTRAS